MPGKNKKQSLTKRAADLLNQIDRVVWLVTSYAGERRGGMIATFVQNASIVPQMPRVILGITKHHHTWSLIKQSRQFALHLLSEENIDLVWRFGLQSGWAVDKFLDLTVERGATGCPLIKGVLAALECRVEAVLNTGDRSVCLAEVVASRGNLEAPPLTVKQALEAATPAIRKQLQDQQNHDIEIDAAAISNWRQQKK